MKRISLLFVVIGLMNTLFSQNPVYDDGWVLFEQDNFNTFNSTRWRKKNNETHGTNAREEPQIYMNQNVVISDGKLVLFSKTEELSCPHPTSCNYGGTHHISSGEVKSRKSYSYGYYEINAKMDVAYQYWPAFWFLNNYEDSITGNCWYNEIDVFEAYGIKPNTVESNAWFGFNCPLQNQNISAQPHNCRYSDDYHWYGIEWDANKINWYVDRQLVRTVRNDMADEGIQHKMYILINLALSPINNETNVALITTPHYMYVDQFNAYHLQYDCNTVINEITNFSSFDYRVKKSISLTSQTVLPAGSSKALRATDYIELSDGFEVPYGTSLYLDITPCNNTIITENNEM